MPKVEVKDAFNNITITLNGDTGDISAGATGRDGDLIVRNTKGTERIRLNGQTGSITASSAAMVHLLLIVAGFGPYCNATRMGMSPCPLGRRVRAFPITAPKALNGSLAFIA